MLGISQAVRQRTLTPSFSGSIPESPAIHLRKWLSGRASPCQGEGRGFDSRLPLQFNTSKTPCAARCFFVMNKRITVDEVEAMRKLVFFVGGAGAGKTTLAKTLAKRRGTAILDMDTVLRPAAVALMTQAGLDPSDRDSIAYKTLCRDLGYRITMDAALENIANDGDIFVIGPFTKETETPHWIEQELDAIGATLLDVDVKVVFVYLRDDKLHYDRIVQRGSALDQYKLDNWKEFRRSLVRRELKWNVPASSVLYFDNSNGLDDHSLAELERFVYAGSS
jgi:dephospho-CoA kinase